MTGKALKASDYIQGRVLNIRFCTRLMGPPFFFWVIPTYRVLPYSMIHVPSVCVPTLMVAISSIWYVESHADEISNK